MSASSRDLSIPDGLILFLPAVPGMLFLYIAEVIPGSAPDWGWSWGFPAMPCWRLSLSGAPFPRRRGCRSTAGTFSGGDWEAIRSIRRCSIWPRVLLPFWA